MTVTDRVVNRGPKRELDGQSGLPRHNRYSIPPRNGTVQCALCCSWVKPEGLADHIRAKHPQEELPL